MSDEQSIRDEIADEISGITVGSGYYSTTIGIERTRAERAEAKIAAALARHTEPVAYADDIAEGTDVHTDDQ